MTDAPDSVPKDSSRRTEMTQMTESMLNEQAFNESLLKEMSVN